MKESLNNISVICTDSAWVRIYDEVKSWDDEKLEYLRIILFSGARPYKAVEMMPLVMHWLSKKEPRFLCREQKIEAKKLLLKGMLANTIMLKGLFND